ncbi:cadherin-like domain-containing protein, partial [Pseudodesulfovibrio pelocollis]|uniref:cadherin-like domain-containing protein n=1 Tax=Pseudodesulfovibrio pelocollis TaxID=3051432 RepID=UPI00255B2E35
MAENDTTQTQVRLTLTLPGDGKSSRFQIAPDMLVAFDFDVSDAIFTGSGNDLVISVEGHGIIVIEDYLVLAEQGALPTFELMGGILVPGDVYLFAFNEVTEEEELETAADGSSGSSGAGAYSDDSGSLVDGFDSLGGQQGLSFQNGGGGFRDSTPGFSPSSTAGASNNPPTINGTLSIVTDEDVPTVITAAQILALVSDPDPGSVLSVTGLSVAGGTLTQIGAGAWLFTPDQDYNGTIAVTFTVTDGVHTVQGQGAITVNPVNDAPVAADDTAALMEKEIITGSVAENDHDVDNTADELTYSLTDPDNTPVGLTFNADGTYTFDASTYDFLTEGETRVFNIGYTVSDGELTDTATLT